MLQARAYAVTVSRVGRVLPEAARWRVGRLKLGALGGELGVGEVRLVPRGPKTQGEAPQGPVWVRHRLFGPAHVSYFPQPGELRKVLITSRTGLPLPRRPDSAPAAPAPATRSRASPIGVPVAVSAMAQRVATALPAGAGRYPAADGEIDHQRPGDCANGHLMPLTGTATVPEELPNAPRVLRVFGN
ncbi:hypothetical protein Sros01_81910 [Streptomyces roseochromogenus]|nr:hypothetical protein Sros01_81910 [Streptomyces roseochromogenus]